MNTDYSLQIHDYNTCVEIVSIFILFHHKTNLQKIPIFWRLVDNEIHQHKYYQVYIHFLYPFIFRELHSLLNHQTLVKFSQVNMQNTADWMQSIESEILSHSVCLTIISTPNTWTMWLQYLGPIYLIDIKLWFRFFDINKINLKLILKGQETSDSDFK